MNPTFFLISGMPGNGKSTLATALEECIGMKNASIIRTDLILNKLDKTFLLPKNLGKFLDSGKMDPEAYKVLFYMTLQKARERVPAAIIIEGYSLLKEQYKDMALDAAKDGNVMDISIENYSFTCAQTNKTYHTEKGERVSMSEAVTRYIEPVRQLLADIKAQAMAEIAPKINYQTFDDLGFPRTNSDSRGKFDALCLPADMSGMRVLDVGTNCGYMAFQCNKRGANVVGIDSEQYYLDIANKLRNSVYLAGGIEFSKQDVFYHQPEQPYDYVLAMSVFHYFRDKQKKFFEVAANMLKREGRLILEVGIPADTPSIPTVHEHCRPIDSSPCHYPNLPSLVKYAKGKFTLAKVSPSVPQHGDAIPRVMTHWRKL